jgi:hypothetical protein
MMKIIEKEFNVETGEEIITERDATPEEIAETQRLETEAAELAAKQAEAAAAKAALLEKLGITEDEARLLTGGI